MITPQQANDFANEWIAAMMTKGRPLYKDRINVDPEVMVGKPLVKGTRLPVERVVAHLAHNLDLNDLSGAYPELTVEDVKACLHYAHVALEEKSQRSAIRLGSACSTVKFLLDQSTDARLLPYLNQLGHDATRITRDHPAGLSDQEVLSIAHQEGAS
jgi:uncharacterized protein (DUF433 family)